MIILFTDGVHNQGIDPMFTIDLARRLGIKVYLVALNASTSSRSKKREMLIQVIKDTGGQFFNGDNPDDLARIYDEIDKLEKSKVFIKRAGKFEDSFSFWASIALVLFLIRVLIQYVWIRYP